MGDRLLTLDIFDIVSGEKKRWVYNVTDSAVETDDPREAIKVTVVSDE